MLGMGWAEIFLVMIIALLAVGPEKLPDVARSLARMIRQVQRVVGDFRETINLEEFDAQVRQSGVAYPGPEAGLDPRLTRDKKGDPFDDEDYFDDPEDAVDADSSASQGVASQGVASQGVASQGVVGQGKGVKIDKDADHTVSPAPPVTG